MVFDIRPGSRGHKPSAASDAKGQTAGLWLVAAGTCPQAAAEGGGPEGPFQTDPPQKPHPLETRQHLLAPHPQRLAAPRSSTQQISLSSQPEPRGRAGAWAGRGPRDGGPERARVQREPLIEEGLGAGGQGSEKKAAEQHKLNATGTLRPSHRASGEASRRRWRLSRF